MIPRTKVFVGSLPPGSKPEELRRLFENYGVVTECDIMNRCGFVHMETQEMAENAIRALNNTNFKGATISVEPGRMKDRGAPRGGGGGLGAIRPGGGGVGIGGRPRIGGMGDRRGGRGAPGLGRGMGGIPRASYGNQNNGGGPGAGVGMGGMRLGGGMGGPMRRDRGGGFNQRNTPYNRNASNANGGRIGGGGAMANNSFDKWQGGPKVGNRNFDDNGSANFSNGPQGGMGGAGNMGTNDRFNSGGFGMGNQDRRGFALPERQMFGNDMGNQSRGQMMGGNSSGGGGFRGGSNNFERRQGGGGNYNNSGDMFSRRGGGGGGGNMNNDNMGGGRGFNRNMGGGGAGGNYNQSFPPLGAGGNRNGPRRDMMSNRRY